MLVRAHRKEPSLDVDAIRCIDCDRSTDGSTCVRILDSKRRSLSTS